MALLSSVPEHLGAILSQGVKPFGLTKWLASSDENGQRYADANADWTQMTIQDLATMASTALIVLVLWIYPISEAILLGKHHIVGELTGYFCALSIVVYPLLGVAWIFWDIVKSIKKCMQNARPKL